MVCSARIWNMVNLDLYGEPTALGTENSLVHTNTPNQKQKLQNANDRMQKEHHIEGPRVSGEPCLIGDADRKPTRRDNSQQCDSKQALQSHHTVPIHLQKTRLLAERLGASATQQMPKGRSTACPHFNSPMGEAFCAARGSPPATTPACWTSDPLSEKGSKCSSGRENSEWL